MPSPLMRYRRDGGEPDHTVPDAFDEEGRLISPAGPRMRRAKRLSELPPDTIDMLTGMTPKQVQTLIKMVDWFGNAMIIGKFGFWAFGACIGALTTAALLADHVGTIWTKLFGR